MLVITRKVNEIVVVRDAIGTLAIVRVLELDRPRVRLKITPGKAAREGDADGSTCDLREGCEVVLGGMLTFTMRLASFKDDRVRLAFGGDGLEFTRGEAVEPLN